MKNKFVMNRDRIFSIGMLIFSAFMAWQTSQIKASFNNLDGSDPGSRLFPYMICILLAVCSVGKFITCAKPDTGKFVGGKKGYLRLLAVFAVLCLYAFLLTKIGFILVTFLSAAALLLMMKEDRKLRWYSPVLFAVILTLVLYVLFETVLKVNLPVGSLWKSLGLV